MAQRDMKMTLGILSKALLWLIYAWVVVNLVLLFLAFVLQLFGANPEAGFADWVYGSVSRSMAPFRGLFEPVALNDKSVLDTSLLFAMIVYAFVALFLRAAIDWLTGWLMRQQRRAAAEASIAPTTGSPPAPLETTAGPTPWVTPRSPVEGDPQFPGP